MAPVLTEILLVDRWQLVGDVCSILPYDTGINYIFYRYLFFLMFSLFLENICL